MIRIEYGKPLTPDAFQAIMLIDKEIYDPSLFTSPARTIQRFHKNPNFFVCAYDDDKLVGAWSTYPVSDDFVKYAYKSEVLLDDDVGAENIISLSKDKINNIMAFDLIVDPAYRGRGIADMLMNGFWALILQKEAEGYRFGKVFGYTITAGGHHMMEKNGATFIHELRNHSGYLFEIDCQKRGEKV